MQRAPTASQCTHCGADIPSQLATAECNDPTCRSQRNAAARMEAAREERRQFARFRREALVPVHGEDVRAYIVPHTDRQIGPVDPAQRRAVIHSLKIAMRRATRSSASPKVAAEATPTRENAAEAAPVAPETCMVCRGWCCQAGKDHAFLKEEALGQILTNRPQESKPALFRDYLRRMPKTHMAGSCVYHGPQGCVLPRQMRADICNTFECPGRQTVLTAMARGDESPMVAVAYIDGEVRDTLPIPSPEASAHREP